MFLWLDWRFYCQAHVATVVAKLAQVTTLAAVADTAWNSLVQLVT